MQDKDEVLVSRPGRRDKNTGSVGGNTKAGDPSTLGAPSCYEVSKKKPIQLTDHLQHSNQRLVFKPAAALRNDVFHRVSKGADVEQVR